MYTFSRLVYTFSLFLIKNLEFYYIDNIFTILQITDGGCLKDCCEIEQDLIVPEKIKKETLERIKMGVE